MPDPESPWQPVGMVRDCAAAEVVGELLVSGVALARGVWEETWGKLDMLSARTGSGGIKTSRPLCYKT